jgi:putative flippase GtrA
MRALTPAFVRFCIVGATTTALQYLILVLLVEFARLSPEVGSSIGFAISAVFSYLLNRSATFRSGAAHSRAAPRFVLMVVAGLCVNAAILYLVRRDGVPYLGAQVIATSGTLVFNFLLSRYWVFRNPDVPQGRYRSEF